MTKMQLFELGSAALQSLLNEPRDIYICPLCLRGLGREAIEKRVLTWEHVPPKAIGGKRLVLTCKKCNSRSGSKLDAAMDRRSKHDRFFAALVQGVGEYEGRLKLGIAGEEINIDAAIRGKDRELKILRELNDPAALQRLEVARKRSVDEGTWMKDGVLQLSIIYGYHQRNAQLADLRVAYLAAFAMFGYQYILQPQFEQVRKQLKHPEREMLPVGFWVFLGWDIRETRAVWIVSEPIPMIFVQIDRRAVILPHQELHADPWSQISRIHSGGKITLHGRDEGWPTRAGFVRDFSHPGGVRIEMIDWNELTPEKWEAEWQGYKLEVSRLNPGRDPERWYWGIIDRTGADLKLGDPAGEAGSLNEARQEALAAVRRILKSRDQ